MSKRIVAILLSVLYVSVTSGFWVHTCNGSGSLDFGVGFSFTKNGDCCCNATSSGCCKKEMSSSGCCKTVASVDDSGEKVSDLSEHCCSTYFRTFETLSENAGSYLLHFFKVPDLNAEAPPFSFELKIPEPASAYEILYPPDPFKKTLSIYHHCQLRL